MACDKITYRTITDAHKDAKQIMSHRKVRVEVYKCKNCGMYHLTSDKTGKLKPAKKPKYPIKYAYKVTDEKKKK